MNMNILQPYLLYIALGAAVLSIICFILAIVAIAANSRLRRRLAQWKDISSSTDLEEVFNSTKGAVAELKVQMADADIQMKSFEAQLQKKVSTPAMRRYNAFAEMGNDLSYSVAFVDDAGDGVVLTSIYGREESVTYGKPLSRGDSDYLLTTEEEAVIQAGMSPASQRPMEGAASGRR